MSTIQRRVLANGDERWRVVWRDDTHRQRALTFTSEESAATWRGVLDLVGTKAALRALDDDPPGPDSRTIPQQCRHHVEHLTNVSDGTRRRYGKVITGDIAPHFGDLPLSLMSRDAGARWINAMRQAGAASKTIRNKHALLSAAMQSAVEEGLIPSNPVKGLKVPESMPPEMIFLTPDEFRRLVNVVQPRWRLLVQTLALTGMRWGEATALTVADLDFHGHTIRIRQAWKATSGAGHQLGAPKSRRGVRTLAMPVDIRAQLAEHVAGRGARAYVFLNSRGGPVRHSSFHEGVWTPAVRAFAGDEPTKHATGGRPAITWTEGPGKRPRIHDLRHSFASWAIQAGHSLTALQRHMGHESIQTTSDRYGHLRRADWDAFADLRISPLALTVTGS